jgi:O-antigen/teichoic acid export membrane protein
LGFQKYNELLKSVSVVVLFRALGAFIGFISGILITRTLGITEAGSYFYAIDFITAVALICGLGFNNILLRELAPIAQEKNSQYKITANFISIIFWVSLASFAAAIFIAYFNKEVALFLNKPQLNSLLIILSPLLLLIPLNNYLVTLLQALKKVFHSALIQFAFFYCLLSLTIFIYAPKTAFETAYIHLFTLLSSVLLGLWFSKQHFARFNHKQLKGKLQGWQHFLTTHLISSFSVILISLINGYFLSNSEFAILTAANRFTLLISFCLIAFNFVAAPHYAELFKQGDIKKLRNYAQQITQILIVITIPSSLLVLLFTDELMYLYGEDFRDYGYILSILVIGQVINAMTGSVIYLLTLSGHEKDVNRITMTISPLSILLSLILASFYGLTGVAISMAFHAIALNISAYILVVKRLGFHTISITRIKS